MPQAKIFGRRWRVATDSLPLMFHILSYLYVAMLALMLAVIVITSSASYQCGEYAQVAVAVFGISGMYVVQALVCRALVWTGWRYGPLEEKKRRPFTVLLYVSLLLWPVIVAFTAYGTYLSVSPYISKSCFDSNPCATFKDIVPSSCTRDKEGDVSLTEACRIVWNNIKAYDSCFSKWTDLAATWIVENANGSTTVQLDDESGGEIVIPTFNYPGTVSCSTKYDPYGKTVSKLYNSSVNLFALVGGASFASTETTKVLPVAYQVILLGFITDSNHTDYESFAKKVPWSRCLSKECLSLLGNECSSWDIFASLPSTYKVKAEFLTVVYLSWAIQIFTLCLFFLSFNALPDYESEESWQGFLGGFAKRIGFLDRLERSTAIDGTDALAGIGKLLHKIFGGIDLDATDFLLGLFLVHLKQKWKRKTHVLEKLSEYGCSPLRRKTMSRFASRLWGILLFPLFQDGFFNAVKECSDEESNVTMEERVESLEFCVLPSDDKSANGDVGMRPADDLPTLQHSIAQIHSVTEIHASMGVPGSLSQKEFYVTRQKRAFLSPLYLKNIKIEGSSIDSEKALKLYMGENKRAVEPEILRMAIDLLPLARAPYGLMGKPWKATHAEKCYHTAMDPFCCCMQTVGPKKMASSYFKKRNMETILKMTGMEHEDLLYVSYSSSTFGKLPYLIMLHKASKSICISIRGTVGLTDLITDLLSNPIDISEQSILGTQFRQELGLDTEETTGDKGMYAHTGVVSSAKCMLEDLEQNGILDALSANPDTVCEGIDPCRSSESHVEYLSKLDEEDEVVLSCERANAIIKYLLSKKGWKVVITGHSLGAAVASLVSFRLLETCPGIECFVFNPPGGLFDSKLANFSKKFCTSIIVGQDAISRLSLLTVKRLIDDMMLALGLCKRPKLSVLLDSIIGRYDDPSVSNILFSTFDDMSEEISSILKQYAMSSNLHKQGVDYRPLYPPGNIVFVRAFGNLETTVKRKVSCLCPGVSKKGRQDVELWDAVWIEAEELMDEGILLSHSMIRHHQLVTAVTALNCSLEYARKRQTSSGCSL
eukprot:jgi/Picsp_1/5558/NSC_02917-R1_sn1-specific diacylglycerol lipase beta